MNKETKHIAPQYYTDIHRLPLDKFINVTCDNTLEDLAIAGTPSQEELKKTWEKIVEEYNMAMTDGTPRGNRIVELYKNIVSNTSKLQTVEMLVPIMEDYYTPQFARDVNKALGTQFKFDPTKRAEYLGLLKRCIDRAKGLKVRIIFDETALRNLIQEQEKKNASPGLKPNRQYFAALLINLSDYAGYNLKENEMTVGHFIERLKRYNSAVSKAQAPKTKTK